MYKAKSEMKRGITEKYVGNKVNCRAPQAVMREQDDYKLKALRETYTIAVR